MYTTRILYLLLTLLGVSVCGYIFAVVKEKILLKKNIILIDKRAVTQTHLDEADVKEFFIDGNRLKTGDEVRVFLKNRIRFSGIVIGAVKKENKMIVVTHKDEIKKFSIGGIKRIDIISRYGKFFV